jgi:pyrroloquinoline quinone biosynthesis protein B
MSAPSLTGRVARVGLTILALLIEPCAAGAQDDLSPGAGSPRLRVLGTAQDGGLPHAACSCTRCERARREPGFARRVASLALIAPRPEGRPAVYLVDATPDVRQQLDALRDVRDEPDGRVDRAPVDGILLTHAHIGHYLGLAFFGLEAINTSDLPVWCTPRMATFLRDNGPWSQLVSRRNLALREAPPESTFELAGGIRVTVVPVPHRNEYSDTVGFRFEGPRRTVLYVPDTDAWERWAPPLIERLRGVDVAILDGTFDSLDELPGRDLSEVPHPLVTRTLDLLQPQVDAGTLTVLFTHMNHSNPVLEPESAARRELERRGFHVLADGQEVGL